MLAIIVYSLQLLFYEHGASSTLHSGVFSHSAGTQQNASLRHAKLARELENKHEAKRLMAFVHIAALTFYDPRELPQRQSC